MRPVGKKIVIVGAGPGGYVAAVKAAQLGAEVTVIERDNVGGTCLNWGCIPSKIMKTTADLLDRFQRSKEFAIDAMSPFQANMPRLLERQTQVIQTQSRGILSLFKRHKVRYVVGHADMSRIGSVIVREPDGLLIEVPYDRLILALGSRPLNFPLCPFDGERIISSNDALRLLSVPESMMIVGGGAVGCEFACIFSSFGTRIILVEAMPRILPIPSVDEDCSRVLHREMKKRKIEVLVNRSINAFEKTGEKCRVVADATPLLDEREQAKITSQSFEVDQILVCIGRRANTDGVGLEKLGVDMDETGWIIANEKMETNVFGVYAVGDVLGPSKIMLAHVASTEACVAIKNAMGGNAVMHYDMVPGAVFTTPEIAHVGLTEVQAKAQGYSVRADSVLFRTLGKAHAIGEIAGHTKIVSDRSNGKILGVHIIGPQATDLIAEGTLAMTMGGRVQDLTETIHAHPTLSEIMLESALKAVDRALHG